MSNKNAQDRTGQGEQARGGPGPAADAASNAANAQASAIETYNYICGTA